MRALFLKEFRQGRPLLIFSLVMALLYAAAYAILGRVVLPSYAYFPGEGPSPLDAGVALAMLFAPPFLALLAGIGLFAGEADHSTLPVLFALPLSRRRIWLGKLLAGLALTAAGTVILLGVGRLLLPAAYHSLPVTAYLPDLCLMLLFVFAVAAFVSALTSNVIAALVGALLVGGLLALGLGLMYFELGALLLGYNPILDVALWGFLVTPALLLASALAVSRGELLQSWRKHAFAVPALVLGLVVTALLVCGYTRWATHYSRADVRSISPLSALANAPAVALITGGEPVPYERYQAKAATGPVDLLGNWSRRPLDWEPGQMGDLFAGPLYRSSYAVVLDLKTGATLRSSEAPSLRSTSRELLSLRWPYGAQGGGAAVSPDGRLAAAALGRQGLTWGTQSWRPYAQELQVFDLQARRPLYREVPGPLRKRPNLSITELEWSHHGDHLAFATAYDWSLRGTQQSASSLYVMRRDGSGLRELAIRPATGDWAWSPTEEVIYALDRGRLYRLEPDGRGPRPIWTANAAGPAGRRRIAGLSPDGRWIVLTELGEEVRTVVEDEEGREVPTADYHQIKAAAVLAVGSDGSESRVLWSYLPPAGEVVGVKTRPGEATLMRVAWSSDSRTLFALVGFEPARVPRKGRPAKSVGPAPHARLLRWHPGEPGLTQIGLDLPYWAATLAAVPGRDEALVWPYPGWHQRARDAVLLVDSRGKVRPFPDAARAVEFADENQFVCFDDAGRMITIAGKPGQESLRATDLATGKGQRLYP